MLSNFKRFYPPTVEAKIKAVWQSSKRYLLPISAYIFLTMILTLYSNYRSVLIRGISFDQRLFSLFNIAAGHTGIFIAGVYLLSTKGDYKNAGSSTRTQILNAFGTLGVATGLTYSLLAVGDFANLKFSLILSFLPEFTNFILMFVLITSIFIFLILLFKHLLLTQSQNISPNLISWGVVIVVWITLGMLLVDASGAALNWFGDLFSFNITTRFLLIPVVILTIFYVLAITIMTVLKSFRNSSSNSQTNPVSIPPPPPPTQPQN